jgi:hypothetical protein
MPPYATRATLTSCDIPMLDLLEPINVWVYFQGTKVLPYLMIWRNRRIKIDTLNLTHTSKEGSLTYYHFSVTAGGNYYRLRFDTKNLKWCLEQVEEN